jgi:hypothetical protein
MITKDEIAKLSKMRSREWIMYHRYQILKLSNDLSFHRTRVKELKNHLNQIQKHPSVLNEIKIPQKEAV